MELPTRISTNAEPQLPKKLNERRWSLFELEPTMHWIKLWDSTKPIMMFTGIYTTE